METIFCGNPQTALFNIVQKRKTEKSALNKRLEPRYYSDREITEIFNPVKDSEPEIKAVNYALGNFARKISNGDLWYEDCYLTGVLYYVNQRKIGYSHKAGLTFSYRAMLRAYYREFLTSIGRNSIDVINDQNQEFGFDIFPFPDQTCDNLDYQTAFVGLLSKLRNQRQADILTLFSTGFNLKEISNLLGIQYYTVRRELCNIRNLVKR